MTIAAASSTNWADAMVCISNCDKITPGMLMAAMRINIPVIFVSGGPMEAGKVNWGEGIQKVDLVSPMIGAGDLSISETELKDLENSYEIKCHNENLTKKRIYNNYKIKRVNRTTMQEQK